MLHYGVTFVLELVGNRECVSGDRVWILGIRSLSSEPICPQQEALLRADQQLGKSACHRSGEVKQHVFG